MLNSNIEISRLAIAHFPTVSKCCIEHDSITSELCGNVKTISQMQRMLQISRNWILRGVLDEYPILQQSSDELWKNVS